MKVLYITPYVPYEGIDHAGGYFFFKYLNGMHKKGIEIYLLAPNSINNQTAIQKELDWLEVKLAGPTNLVQTKNIIRKLPGILRQVIHPIGLHPTYMKALTEAISKDRFLEQFDIVELQWSQMLPLAVKIKHLVPDIPLICLEHDIITQSIIRRSHQRGWSKNKVHAILVSLKVKEKEREYLNLCNKIFTFSQKDKNLLLEMNVNTPIESITPALEIPQVKADLNGPPVCLFVGAMQRHENQEAMRWFISKVWNNVLSQIPKAKLVIAGANPPSWLENLKSDKIEVTGYVEDLDTYYAYASVFVAPLLTGAGVKFKVVQALAFGLPVVTTPIGAEGINEEGEYIFALITSNPNQFAQEIICLLKDRNYRNRIGQRARDWALEKYDFQKNTVDKVYGEYLALESHIGVNIENEKNFN